MIRPREVAALVLLPAVLLVGCVRQTGVGNDVTGSSTLARAGIDPAAIQHLIADLRTDVHPDLKSVLILRHGGLVSETYFNGADSETLHDIRSAGKSITATLVGIAIDEGLIGSVDEPLGRYFPDQHDPKKTNILIRDVLTMRSGLAADDADTTSPGNEALLDMSPDFVDFVFQLPMKSVPGSIYVYASANAFLAGALVENAAKMRLDQFAQQSLFTPLGIDKFTWRLAPHNRGVGQGNLSLRARDIARIGQLFLDHGSFDGRQVVSAAWVKASLEPHASIGAVDRYADGYGYMWYSKTYEIAGRQIQVQFASGNGGNKIYLVPGLDLVVVVTSSAYGRGYGQERAERILLGILASVHPA